MKNANRPSKRKIGSFTLYNDELEVFDYYDGEEHNQTAQIRTEQGHIINLPGILNFEEFGRFFIEAHRRHMLSIVKANNINIETHEYWKKFKDFLKTEGYKSHRADWKIDEKGIYESDKKSNKKNKGGKTP